MDRLVLFDGMVYKVETVGEKEIFKSLEKSKSGYYITMVFSNNPKHSGNFQRHVENFFKAGT